MTNPVSQMKKEIREIPDAVERLLTRGSGNLVNAATAVRELGPSFAMTVARGSSDHACSFLKYAIELELGIPVASVGPSIASIYKAPMSSKGGLCISVSQSGMSPDIVEMTEAARRGGALALALTNNSDSPLVKASNVGLDIAAGPELSVAATKTFVNSVVAGLFLLAEWKGDQELLGAIHDLPANLAKAAGIDWPEIRTAIGENQSLFTLGRGPSWAISNEAALKFKETCQIHAESYSSAEVLHGPVSIVDSGFPILCFAASDAAESSLCGVADQISGKAANVFVTSARTQQAQQVEHVRTGHCLTDPISLIVSFYSMVERLAAERNINPDKPRHLAKVTSTV